MPRYTIEDRLFTALVIDAVTAVTATTVPEAKAGVEVATDLRFAAKVEQEIRKRLEAVLNGGEKNRE